MNQSPFGNDFDRNFSRHQKMVKRGFMGFGLVFLIWALVWLSGVSVVVYVAYHFISKVW